MNSNALIRLALTATFAAIFAISLGACGGDDADALDLDAYLSEMERLDNEAEARQDALRQQFELATTGDSGTGSLTESFKDALEAYYVGLVDTGKDFINQVDDLQPPEEAQDVHDEYIAAYDELLVQLNVVIDEIPGLTTAGELDALLATPELDAAFARGNAACADLQQLATDNNSDVDFGCQT